MGLTTTKKLDLIQKKAEKREKKENKEQKK